MQPLRLSLPPRDGQALQRLIRASKRPCLFHCQSRLSSLSTLSNHTSRPRQSRNTPLSHPHTLSQTRKTTTTPETDIETIGAEEQAEIDLLLDEALDFLNKDTVLSEDEVISAYGKCRLAAVKMRDATIITPWTDSSSPSADGKEASSPSQDDKKAQREREEEEDLKHFVEPSPLRNVIDIRNESSERPPRSHNPALSRKQRARARDRERAAEEAAAQSNGTQPSSQKQRTTERIARVTIQIFEDPKVFLTPSVLTAFVALQLLLKTIHNIVPAFEIYPSKPIPLQDTSPIQFRTPRSDSHRYAIPKDVADAALRAAISAHDLVMSINVIDTTVRKRAFKRAKFLSSALAPTAALSLIPPMAYIAGDIVAQWQGMMPVSSFRTLFVGGVCAYVFFTASLGINAAIIASDHFRRVVWIRGLGLRTKFFREDERAMFDKVVCAWGYKQKRKWGTESGEEWMNIREMAGLRDMVVDTPTMLKNIKQDDPEY